MRLLVLLAICLVQLALNVQAVSKYTVIGPGTLHPKNKYNVAVAVYHNNEPATIKVGLTGPSYSDFKTVQLITNEIKNVEFDVPELVSGDYNLTAEGVSGLVFKNTTKLNFEEFHPYIKIQTDKGTYKPGDVVNFRVIFLDKNLLPAAPKKEATVWFEDSQRNRIKSYTSFPTTKGVYTDSFQISEFPMLGYWRLMVLNGQTYPAEAGFEIAKYELPKFTVKMESTERVAVQDGDVQVIVRSNYTYDKPFNGKVTLVGTMSDYQHFRHSVEDKVVEIPKLIKTTDMVNGKAKFDLNLRYYEEYMTRKRTPYHMSFLATVEENFTGVKRNVTGSSTIYPYRYSIQCLSYGVCSTFKADEETEISIKITTVDNTEVKDTKSVVKLTYTESIEKIHWYHREEGVSEKETPKIEGKVFVFESHMNESSVATFKVTLSNLDEFEGFSHYYKVKGEYAGEDHDLYSTFQYKEPKEPPVPYEEPKDYLRLTVHHEKNKYSLHFGADAKLTLNSSEPLSYFVYDIVARGNILRSERVVLPEPVQVYNFTIPTTFIMTPRCSVYVHYVDEKGEYHYAETTIHIDVELQNKIEITAPNQVKPGDDVQLKIKTLPNSFVGLLAVDQSVLLLSRNNELNVNDFNWRLGSYSTNTPWQGGYSYYPGSQAGVVTLTDAEYFYNRTQPEYGRTGIVNKIAYAGAPMAFGSSSVMHGSPAYAPNAPAGAGAPEVRVRKNFVETWIFDNIENTETEEFTWAKQIPDTITSWIISGFSINPDKGIGVTQDKSKVITFQQFFVSIRLPYSVKRGEVVNVPALVFNYLDKALDVMVTLDNTDGEYDFTDVSNEVLHDQKRTKTVQVSANSAAGVSFLIRPKVIGHIMLKFTAISPIAGDEVHKTLKVVPEGVTEYGNRAYFVNLKNEPEHKETFELELPKEIVPDSEHIEFTVVGDLLGPLLNNLDRLVRTPIGCGEQTISSMIPNYLALDYLMSIKKLPPALGLKIKRNLEEGYQRILRYRNKDGSFSSFAPWIWARSEKPLSGSTWLTAYIIAALIETSQFISIDDKVVQEGLLFLVSRQAENGSFVEGGDVFYAAQNHHLTLTATVLQAFVKNQTNTKLFQPQIQKALNYIFENLDKTDDLHAKVYGIYTLQQVKHEKVFELLGNLKAPKSERGFEWWTDEKEGDIRPLWGRWASSNDVEITSYVILTLLDFDYDADMVLAAIKWLVAQRNSYGGFVSTQDTVVGLKALIKFARKLGYEPAIMDIDYSTKGVQQKQDTVKVTEDNGLLLQVQELPQSTYGVDFHAKGMGAALIQVSYQYNVLEKEKKPSFTVNTIINKETPQLKLELDVCVEYVDEAKASNMAVLEVSLPSGYTADEDTFEDIEKIDRVRLVETKNDNTIIVVYFESLPKGEVKCIPIGAFRTFAVALQKPSPVVLYDYYDTSKRATTYYEVISKVCEICDNDEECQKSC